MKINRLYVLVSSQGTACPETALCEIHYNEGNRRQAELNARNYFPKFDAPVPGSWTDATENEVVQEVGCHRC